MVHTIEFVNIHPGEVAFFRFANGRVANNVRYGLIDSVFLVVVKLLIGAQKCIGLLELISATELP